MQFSQHVSKHLCANAMRLSYFCFILLGIYWDSSAVADADDAIPKWEHIKYNSFSFTAGTFCTRKKQLFHTALQFCYWREKNAVVGVRNEIYYQSSHVILNLLHTIIFPQTHIQTYTHSSTSKVVRVVNRMSIGDLYPNKPFHIVQTYDNFLVNVHQFYFELCVLCTWQVIIKTDLLILRCN